MTTTKTNNGRPTMTETTTTTGLRVRGSSSLPALKPSGDTKTSPAVRVERSKTRDLVGSAFGESPGPIADGGTCEGATDACWPKGADPREATCYVGQALRYSAVPRLLAHNRDTVDAILADGGVSALADAFYRDVLRPFGEGCERRDVPRGRRMFRLYWSGDVRDEAIARAWALAVTRAVRADEIDGAWIYTRHHRTPVVRALLSGDGLAVYLSVDQYNGGSARRVLRRLAGKYGDRLHVAPMAETAEAAEALRVAVREGIAEADGPTITCPVGNRGSWRNVVPATGSLRTDLQPGADAVGACSRCGHCTFGRGDVRFPIH